MSTQESIRHEQFFRLWSAHSRRIFGFILSQCPLWSDAEDIFQETSVVIWRKFESYQNGTSFSAWTRAIAHNEILEHRRKQHRRKVQLLLSDEAVESLRAHAAATADNQLPREEEALVQCLEKLSERDRVLIQRRYFRAETAKQIANDTSMSIHVVYRSLARVHDRLMRCVRRSIGDAL